MKQTTFHRFVLSVGMTVMAGFPIGNAWASSVSAHTAAAHASSPANAAKSRTFKGPTIGDQHGPVQVSIVVKSRKITKVSVANSPADARSVIIQGNAIPLLKRETLKAQSAKINEVSGATETSGAYIQSLQAAVKTAGHDKALK